VLSVVKNLQLRINKKNFVRNYADMKYQKNHRLMFHVIYVEYYFQRKLLYVNIVLNDANWKRKKIIKLVNTAGKCSSVVEVCYIVQKNVSRILTRNAKLAENLVGLISIVLIIASPTCKKLFIGLRKYCSDACKLNKKVNVEEKIKKYKYKRISKVRCVRCNKTGEYSKHHIVPRKYGGTDNIVNKIILCYKCHDYVEIKTEEYIEKYGHTDIDTLKSLIINDGF
jgi:hypothetical protein